MVILEVVLIAVGAVALALIFGPRRESELLVVVLPDDELEPPLVFDAELDGYPKRSSR